MKTPQPRTWSWLSTANYPKADLMNVAASDADLSRPARKRQRIPLACSTCRDRKTKCNGDRPVCSACLRRGLQDTCDYEDGPSKTQKYINELEDRVKELERGHLVTPHVTSQLRNEADEFELSTACHAWNRSGESEVRAGDLSLSYNEPHSVDALATVSSLDRTDGFYGDSSTIAFVAKVKDATNPEPNATQNMHASPSEQTPQSGTGSLQGFQLTRNHDPSAFVLPPRKIADDFLYCFWEYIHPLFPVIHKPTLLDTYKKLWGPTSPQSSTAETELKDVTFFSTLNLIFALGCQFSTQVQADKKVVRAKQFYEKSKSLLVVDILDAMHLPLVQALLLAGVYLQSTKHANRCWNIVGLAIRVAQGLGLHIEQLTSGSIDQVETEMRRRIWHTCVMLDRLLAMTFGRPTTIPRTWNVETPSMIDDEYLLHYGTASQPPHLHSRLGLFVYSTKLYEILDDILATFYIHDKGKLLPRQSEKAQRATDGLNEVLNLNSKLDEFLDTLPNYLKFHDKLSSAHEKANHIKLQVNVLNSRFLYTRILLLRPVLLAMAQEQIGSKIHAKEYSEPKLQQELAMRACVLCISAAHKLIAQIHENLESVHRSSAWHSVYFTFAASTILIAAHLCNLDGIDANAETFQISRTRSMAILEHYSPQVPSAFQAISVLKALRNRIFTSERNSTTNAPRTGQDDPIQPPSENYFPTIPNQGASDNTSNIYPQETSQYNLEDFAPISDAWFTEQFINFDWLNTPWEQNGFNF